MMMMVMIIIIIIIITIIIISSGTTQDCQVFQAGKHTHVLPHCHRNSRHMG